MNHSKVLGLILGMASLLFSTAAWADDETPPGSLAVYGAALQENGSNGATVKAVGGGVQYGMTSLDKAGENTLFLASSATTLNALGGTQTGTAGPGGFFGLQGAAQVTLGGAYVPLHGCGVLADGGIRFKMDLQSGQVRRSDWGPGAATEGGLICDFGQNVYAAATAFLDVGTVNEAGLRARFVAADRGQLVGEHTHGLDLLGHSSHGWNEDKAAAQVFIGPRGKSGSIRGIFLGLEMKRGSYADGPGDPRLGTGPENYTATQLTAGGAL